MSNTKNINALEELQLWFRSQCDEHWERTYGIQIGTMDNPGWSLFIDLTDTDVELKSYKSYSYGITEQTENGDPNWLFTKKESNRFIAYGGPEKLEEIIRIFLEWAKSPE